MSRPTFLPYTKSIPIADSATSGVHFTDLAGATVNATYIQVATLEDSISAEGENTDEAFFMVEPSGLVSAATWGYNSTLIPTAPPGATNASACVIGGPNQPIVELSLPSNQGIDSIRITNHIDASSTFIVTYGHIKPANDLADIRNLDNGAY